MPQEPAGPLREPPPDLVDQLVNRARHIFGNGSRGDEVVSRVADKLNLSAQPNNLNSWLTAVVWNAYWDSKRQEKSDQSPRGHHKKPLTMKVGKKGGGDPVEVERPQLADAGLSVKLSAQAEELRQLRQASIVKPVSECIAVILEQSSDTYRGLYKALLTNIMGDADDYKNLDTLRNEHGIVNITYHKQRLLDALAKCLKKKGLDREALAEFDASDFYNLVDEAKMTRLHDVSDRK
jgi:DNA-directed RNA polymerase specialized sigma24 family protein